jgi:hypothetical protein
MFDPGFEFVDPSNPPRLPRHNPKEWRPVFNGAAVGVIAVVWTIVGTLVPVVVYLVAAPPVEPHPLVILLYIALVSFPPIVMAGLVGWRWAVSGIAGGIVGAVVTWFVAVVIWSGSGLAEVGIGWALLTGLVAPVALLVGVLVALAPRQWRSGRQIEPVVSPGDGEPTHTRGLD